MKKNIKVSDVLNEKDSRVRGEFYNQYVRKLPRF